MTFAPTFLSESEMHALEAAGNTFISFASTRISRVATIGTGNTFYPNVVVACRAGSTLTMGDGNTLYPNTWLESSAPESELTVGDNVEFGPGLVTIRANAPAARIAIRSAARLRNQVELYGTTTVGHGSQLLGGPLVVTDCELEGGADFTEIDYDQRGAVAKGLLTLRGMSIPRGHSAVAQQTPTATHIVTQRSLHEPRGPR